MTLASADPDVPLVSIVVRSMGRPEIRQALQSIADQDYPSIEAIVVDATGGHHPELPRLAWKPGHRLRMVRAAQRLPRPLAANAGLQVLRGAWFTFLDDDDTCDATHVSTLVAGALEHSDALVVYGRGRLFGADGREQRAVGRPFNRALIHYTPLFYWQAALISARVRMLGCRFDPALAVCEDRDFLAQIAVHGDFVFLPSAATFRFRPDLGTSGTGEGMNRDVARVARFDNMLRAKWAGSGEMHNERAAWRCRAGVRAYFAGDLAGARAMFIDVLALYPDDPSALHGMARVALACGDRSEAERYVRRAIDVNPRAAEFRATLAEIVGGAGKSVDPGRAVPREANTSSRLALCACGSGRRVKACCGRLESSGGAVPAVDVDLARANDARLSGEATVARAWLRAAVADPRASRERLLAAAHCELDLGAATAAYSLLERAAAIRVDTDVGVALETCCAQIERARRDASLWSTVSELIHRAPAASAFGERAARAAPTSAPAVHLVVGASDARRSRSVMAMQAALSKRAAVLRIEAGATLPPETAGACIVLCDADIEFAPSPHGPPARIVVRMDGDDPAPLLRALTRCRDLCPDAVLQFTRPCEAVAADTSGTMPVEYPWLDIASCAGSDGRPVQEPITIGRPGPAVPLDDHPDDPALYRALIRDGHRVAMPETPFLLRAFRDDPPGARPVLDAGPDFLARTMPDIVLHRGHHGGRGCADERILAAMAAGRPVVVFTGALGASEWIEDGRTGFVVETADEARTRIALLARERTLRAAMGRAAREAAIELMRRQRERALRFYFGTGAIE
jgi:tetratricopeptide (TPR) repeat protein